MKHKARKGLRPPAYAYRRLLAFSVLSLSCCLASSCVYNAVKESIIRKRMINGPYVVIDGKELVVMIDNPQDPVTGHWRYGRFRKLRNAPRHADRYVYACEDDRLTSPTCIQLDLITHERLTVEHGYERDHLDPLATYERNFPKWRNGRKLSFGDKSAGTTRHAEIPSYSNKYYAVFSMTASDRVTRKRSLWGDGAPGSTVKTRYWYGTLFLELFEVSSGQRLALLQRRFAEENPNDTAICGMWSKVTEILVVEDAFRCDQLILVNPNVLDRNNDALRIGTEGTQ